MCFYFTLEFLICWDLFSVFVGIKTCPCWICYECVQFQIELRQIRRCGSHSPHKAEFGHFSLLFCRERQRNVPRIKMHEQQLLLIKVAEQSLRARSCWCDSARAQGLQKQTCRWYSDHFIRSMPALSLLFFFVIERNVLMALVFYNKGMLEKVTTQRTQQFSNFSKSKEPS